MLFSHNYHPKNTVSVTQTEMPEVLESLSTSIPIAEVPPMAETPEMAPTAVATLLPPTKTSVTKAFPSAYGGGAEATGARADDNAVLVIIDTLDFDAPLTYDAQADVYSGGIKAAFEDELEGRGRYIISNVSGVITGNLPRTTDGSNIGWPVSIHADRRDNITFMGQSAPEGGLTLHRGGLKIIRSSNVIIRYLTIRPGAVQGNPIPDDKKTSPFIIGASNAIVDHLSASWGGDKGLIIGDWRKGEALANVTVQRSLVADSHTLAFGVNGGGNAQDWSEGGNVTWHYNYLAGRHRTPNMGGFDGLGVIQNNVIFSNGSRLSNIVYGTPQINHVNNYYRVFSTHGGGIPIMNTWQDLGFGDVSIHTAGNYYQNKDGVLLEGQDNEDNRVIWRFFGKTVPNPLPDNLFADTPHKASNPNPLAHPAPLLPAVEAFDQVLADVGNNAYLDNDGRPQIWQDDYDATAIDNAYNDVLTFRKYSSDWQLPEIPQNQRPPSYDTDRDGIADAWERREFGDLSQGYRDDFDGDGYTNIEEYMNQVDFL